MNKALFLGKALDQPKDQQRDEPEECQHHELDDTTDD